MDTSADPIEKISFLARSESRVQILQQLFESGPATQRDLRAALEKSRSTVARSLTSLEEQNWVVKEHESYHLTPVGKLLTEEFLELAETVQTTEKLSVFLTWFPYFDHDLDIESLQSANITVYTAGEPYAPGRSQTEFIQETDVFRGIFPAIDLEGAKVAHEQIMNETLKAEIIVSPEVKKTIISGEFAPIFREQLQTGRLTVLSLERSIPFYVGLSDEKAIQIGVEDEDGMPRALLESSDETLREWAEGQYQDYRTEAQIVSLDHFA